jgi:hypothetical protein
MQHSQHANLRGVTILLDLTHPLLYADSHTNLVCFRINSSVRISALPKANLAQYEPVTGSILHHYHLLRRLHTLQTPASTLSYDFRPHCAALQAPHPGKQAPAGSTHTPCLSADIMLGVAYWGKACAPLTTPAQQQDQQAAPRIPCPIKQRVLQLQCAGSNRMVWT